jgi:parvulin-like peptidyl-prolyl isomerase
VAPRGDIVFQVGEHKYTYAYLEDRVKSDDAQGNFDPQDVATSISNTIARIQREELVRQMGKERGITVSDAEIDDKLREILLLPDEATHNEIAAELRGQVRDIDLSLGEYLPIIEASVIEDKIKAELTASLPEEAEQVNLLYIQAGSQANAIQALQELDEGADFGEVAAKRSQDSASRSDGVLGWVPREYLDPELADIAFSMTGRSGIIETEEDFYIIEVLGKETRPIDPAVVQDIGVKEFNKLLETAFDDTPFLYNLSQDQIFDLASAVGASIG